MAPRLAAVMLTAAPEPAFGQVPGDLAAALGDSASQEALAPFAEFVATHRQERVVLPDPDRVFAATPFDAVRAVILGQDSYPTRAPATGLAFSVPRDLAIPLPRSQSNIRAELASDLGIELPAYGLARDLDAPWRAPAQHDAHGRRGRPEQPCECRLAGVH